MESFTLELLPKSSLGASTQAVGMFGFQEQVVPQMFVATMIFMILQTHQPQGLLVQKNQATVSITYGTGQVVASRVYDTMTLGGITLEQQYFGSASKLSPDFATLSCDGLVGLAFPSMSHFASSPPFWNAASQNLLTSSVFGIFLDPATNVEPAGSISMGTIDATKYTGDMTTIPVTQEMYWSLALGKVTLGNSSFTLSVNTAVLDSGTTAIFLPAADATAINQAIPTSTYWAAQDIYNVSCDHRNMPDLVFTLGGLPFSVPPSLYIQVLTNTAGRSLGICASAIIGGQSRVILGTNFLRAWYTQYNFTNGSSSVGLARAVGVVSSQGTAVTSAGKRLLAKMEEPLDLSVLHKRHYDSFDQPRWGWVAPARRDHNFVTENGQD